MFFRKNRLAARGLTSPLPAVNSHWNKWVVKKRTWEKSTKFPPLHQCLDDTCASIFLLASLLQKPLTWASFCSWSWIFFCTLPTILRKCHACQKWPLEIFSKQGPKVWCRDSIFGCKQSTVLQMNKIKAVWGLPGEETNINSNTDLLPECVGAPSMGYTQKRSWVSGNEEICESAQWKNKKPSLCSSYLYSKVPDG